MGDNKGQPSSRSTLPTIITAVAGLIAAVAGLLQILYPGGIRGLVQPATPTPPTPTMQARVRVNFTQITVQDDGDPTGSGEIWLDFNVSGQTGRWPSSGTNDVESGNTYNIGKTFDLPLSKDERLTIFVNGMEEDSPGFPFFDDNDQLGSVSKEYVGANEWGQGNHSELGSSPDGSYVIHYTIDVNWQ